MLSNSRVQRPLVSLIVLSLIVRPCLGQQPLNVTCNTAGLAQDCSGFVTTFCSSIGTDLIAQEDTVSRCFTTSSATKCDLAVWNTLTGSNTPSVQNCETALARVAAICAMGGSGIFVGAPFKFFLQEDTGACGPPFAS
ncbi:hypothetical protein GGX14DRAFT_577050 [Mycena pura]|uniref:Glycan binding protein Y3-like domain-containing protein n=1 Tax=Mycena pura TaxID=153505 RepID=A0AAD6UU23_9AGAR|nr:hypothetical protein GGX14DRAFT_577050 [Mycena pura]